MLSLALLGPPEVRHHGRLLTFPTRKALALLVYLVVQGGRQPREKLTALFWPDSDGERGRAALRQTLALLGDVLRGGSCQVGGSHLVVRRDALAFDFGSPYQLDVQLLYGVNGLVGGSAERSVEWSRSQLGSVVDLYRGDFLEGFSLTDAPEFDTWVSVQREAVHRRMDLMLDRLSCWQAEGGELNEAIDTAARWVAHSRWNEAAHRRLMQLHFAAGDRTAALLAYEACRVILTDELSTQPDQETETLVERIRSAEPRLRMVREQEPPIPFRATEGPLVGRTHEHAMLVAAYQSARKGRTQAVVVRGEAGIGKTRLVGEFLRWASAHGADLLEGRAFEAGGRLPYQPLIEAFRARLRMEPDLRPLLSQVWLSELSRLLPELRDRYPDLPLTTGFDEAEAQARLFEAIAQLGAALAARSPTILFVDDLHWADAASLDLLHYVCRQWERSAAPILLILSLRQEELAERRSLGDWLTALGRDLPSAAMTLGPLSACDTLRLLRSLWKGDLASDWDPPPRPMGEPAEVESLGRWLFDETRGQPFFIGEMLKSLFERGVLQIDRDGTWELRTEAVSADYSELRGLVPPSIREVIRARLDRLSQTSRRLLAAAAILGHRFDFEQLRWVADLGESDGLAAVDELLARYLLQETDESSQLTFGHDKVREVVYAEAGDPRRRVLHRRAIDVLEGAHAPAAELARHALAAGLPERAFELSLAAGDDALRLFAVRDAIMHYERARTWIEQAANRPTSGAQAHHLYAQLGRAHELSGDHASARRCYEAMLSLAQKTDRTEMESTALNRLAALAVQGALNLEAASTLLGTARLRVEASGDKIGLADTELNEAQVDVYRWDLDAALAHGGRALALARELQLREHVARSLNLLALAENAHGKVAEAAAHAEEALTLATALGNHALEADCLCLLAEARIRLGRPREGIAAARAARALSLQIDNPYERARSAHKLAIGLIDTGDYEEALQIAGEGIAIARATENTAFVILNLILQGNAQRALWRLEEAYSSHLEAMAVNESVPIPPFTELIAGMLCADAALANDWAQAQAYARRALAVRDYGILYTGFYRWYETEALLRAGDEASAAEDLRRLGLRVDGNARYRLPYLRAVAVLERWKGQLGQASRSLEAAAELSREIGMPGETWQIQKLLGDLYASTNQHVLADQAHAAAAEGLRAVASRIQDPDLRARFLENPLTRQVLQSV